MSFTIDTFDDYRLEMSKNLTNKLEYSQYLTPISVAKFMTSLFNQSQNKNVKILDAGAGIGTLTATLLEKMFKEKVSKVNCIAVEIDKTLGEKISENLSYYQTVLDLNLNYVSEDFIEWAVNVLEGKVEISENQFGDGFSHIILNPPYKKLKNNSRQKQLLFKHNIETVNLYSAFLALSIKLLAPGGQIVAIVPRSFCNGPYYKKFRKLILDETIIKQFHLFEARNKAFKDDQVLQENVIIVLERSKNQGQVKISTSTDDSFSDFKEDYFSFEKIVLKNDEEFFFHIPLSKEINMLDRFPNIKNTLHDLEIDVSTGPVVGFRTKENLSMDVKSGGVPLIHATDINSDAVAELKWNKVDSKKPKSIFVNEKTVKMLYPMGFYTIIRRRSTKEERKRIISGVISSEVFSSNLIGFDNGLNVLNKNKKGLEKELAYGLSVYLSSTLVDQYFRVFNGHTQVNATDLRSMLFPSLKVLKAFGKWFLSLSDEPSQIQIDIEVEKILQSTGDKMLSTETSNIMQAIELLKDLGLPKAQQNERTGITLLALLNIGPEKSWHESENQMIGITPIIEFGKNKYNKMYAPNTRESVRRQSIHQFVESGIAICNPDKPDRAVNSPKTVYQIEPQTFELIKKYGTVDWEEGLKNHLQNHKTLIEKYAKERMSNKIPIEFSDGQEIRISPGEHSELIKDIIEDFGARFVPGGSLIYAGDTGKKMGYFDQLLLKKIGVEVDAHGKMPDVILFCSKRNWLILIEAVTSHGPVDGKRHNELERLFKDSKAGIVYVTAFPNRSMMSKYLGEIAWETEVWVSDAPSHLIHFNGVRFLGPY